MRTGDANGRVGGGWTLQVSLLQKNRQIVGLECGDMSSPLKREHVRAPQKLFWLGCQLEPNCVTFLSETQTAKIQHGLRIASHEIA
jgi:hypothetical protein